MGPLATSAVGLKDRTHSQCDRGQTSVTSANAAYERWTKHSDLPTEITEMPGRGHSLILDHGWGEVADTVLAFLDRNAITPS